MHSKFIEIPVYLPYILTGVVSRRIVWHDEKAQVTCEKRNISHDKISAVFVDENRMVGLSEVAKSILYFLEEGTNQYKPIVVEEDRFFIFSDELIVFFVLKNEQVQIITAYWLKDKKLWKKLVKFMYAFRAVPEIVAKNFNKEAWLPIAITEHGAIAHAIIKLN